MVDSRNFKKQNQKGQGLKKHKWIPLVVLINKTDTKEYFDFDDKAVVERIHERNPLAKVFFVSAKTGEGFEEWISWLDNNIKEWIGGTV